MSFQSGLLFPLAWFFKNSQTYGINGLCTEIKSVAKGIFSPPKITHLFYVERMLGLLPTVPQKMRGSLVGTVHQPQVLWSQGRHKPEMVASLDALIVLSNKEREFFEQFMPGKVHVILHGVDVEFFQVGKLSSELQKDRPRFIFSGIWLRDLETLGGVVEKTLSHDPGIRFDLLVPKERRDHPSFEKLKSYEQVSWQAGLSDEQLRDLYQGAAAIVLPFKECTANNALVEGLACGLPVVSNDVGGVPDYTDPEFADLFPCGDVDGMTEALLTLAQNPDLRKERGAKARLYAETHLSWKNIASQTLDVYRTLTEDL